MDGITPTAFLSTSSARRTTSSGGNGGKDTFHFYPRPPRGGRLHWIDAPSTPESISIHVLREEDDLIARVAAVGRVNFYPRPPRGGRRQHRLACRTSQQFLSTSSARRTTRISKMDGITPTAFLSTSSARRTTHDRERQRHQPGISIHVLREEDDPSPSPARPRMRHFYPRPPRGGRHGNLVHPPSREISIHVLREEDDSIAKTAVALVIAFLSTSSARRTTSSW